MNWVRWSIVWLCLAGGLAGRAARVDFNRDIRPLMSDTCFRCHGFDATARKGKLRLDVRDEALKPAKSGAVPIVPGRPEASEVLRRLESADPEVAMPPPELHKPWTVEQRELFRRWIAEGAEYKGHWAFLPPVRPVVPAVAGDRTPLGTPNPIDAFVRARLAEKGLRPSREADRATLVRRVTLDLTGLPPTPAEVDAFVGDGAPDAYAKLVDRLLASPRYGERMAQDWLDAARFADSNGYQVDRDRELWGWRDWVIGAFNRNLPFDRFTIEQLAGDLLPEPTTEQRIATGFHRNHMINEEGGIIDEEFLAEYCADRVETTATVWMGLTFNCARCHDHKYDPIPQRDFYSLLAFFHNVPEKGVGDYGANIRRSTPPFLKLPSPELEATLSDLQRQVADAERQLKDLDASLESGMSAWEKGGLPKDPPVPAEIVAIVGKPAAKRSESETRKLRDFRFAASPERVALAKKTSELKARADAADLAIPVTLVMAEMGTPRPTFVLKRGAYDHPGDKVDAGTPSALPPFPAGLPRNRLGLARWLTDPNHPLTARVTVNRFWQSLFGTGLVRTAGDFGSQGEVPSHPELLDWLATEFVASGWNVKSMIRGMVLSETYRQDSRTTPEMRSIDPENRLLARGPRYRLPAEAIRDQALAVAGLLGGPLGGPSVRPYHPPGLYEQVVAGSSANTYVPDHGAALYRRTLYTYWKRSVPNPSLLLFDMPFRETCTVRRARTTTPLQALDLLNDPTYVEAARALAQRMVRDGGDSPESRVRLGFRLVMARSPKPAELEVLVAGYGRALAGFRSDPSGAAELLKVGESRVDPAIDPVELAAYTTVASTLLNLDETVTRE